MLGRAAACAAVLFLYSAACAGAGENTLPPAQIASAIVQPANDRPGSANSASEKSGRLQKDAVTATAVEKAGPANATPISFYEPTVGGVEPFGLNAEPTSTGEVLDK